MTSTFSSKFLNASLERHPVESRYRTRDINSGPDRVQFPFACALGHCHNQPTVTHDLTRRTQSSQRVVLQELCVLSGLGVRSYVTADSRRYNSTVADKTSRAVV
jgi:hypothetical protein